MASKAKIIRGVVRDEAGKPLTQVRVWLSRGPCPLPDIAQVSARDGVFIISAPVAGEYEVCFQADGFLPATSRVAVKAQKSSEIQITLKKPHSDL